MPTTSQRMYQTPWSDSIGSGPFQAMNMMVSSKPPQTNATRSAQIIRSLQEQVTKSPIREQVTVREPLVQVTISGVPLQLPGELLMGCGGNPSWPRV